MSWVAGNDLDCHFSHQFGPLCVFHRCLQRPPNITVRARRQRSAATAYSVASRGAAYLGVLRREVAHVPGPHTVIDARPVQDVVVLVVEHRRHNNIGGAELVKPASYLCRRQVVRAAPEVKVRRV